MRTNFPIWIEKPDVGLICPYFGRIKGNEVYGECKAPANFGSKCSAYGPVHSRCPLPGWDRPGAVNQ